LQRPDSWLAPSSAVERSLASDAPSALSGEVGVATEMLLTKADRCRTTGRAPTDYAFSASERFVAVAPFERSR